MCTWNREIFSICWVQCFVYISNRSSLFMGKKHLLIFCHVDVPLSGRVVFIYPTRIFPCAALLSSTTPFTLNSWSVFCLYHCVCSRISYKWNLTIWSLWIDHHHLTPLTPVTFFLLLVLLYSGKSCWFSAIGKSFSLLRAFHWRLLQPPKLFYKCKLHTIHTPLRPCLNSMSSKEFS